MPCGRKFIDNEIFIWKSQTRILSRQKYTKTLKLQLTRQKYVQQLTSKSTKCTCMHTSVDMGKLYTVGFRSAVSYGSYTYVTDMGYFLPVSYDITG